MGLATYTDTLYDINGNSYGVSGTMSLPSGALGQLIVGVNPTTQKIEYLNSVSGVLQTSITFPSQLQISNFPATQNVSGTVSVQGGTAGSVAPVQVWTEGAFQVSGTVTLGSQVQVSNFPATQNVSGTVTVQGGTAGSAAPVQVWNEGLVGVSGSVTIGAWAANQTGSVTVQGAPGGYLAPVQIWSEGNIGVSGTFTLGSQVQVSNFPATQNVSGTVTAQGGTAGSVAPVQIWSEGNVGVSGTVTLGSQVQVSNFPATQNVSGSITVGAWAANQTGSVTVQGAPGGYLAPVQIWSEGNIGVSGSFSLSGQIGVNNFPATQNVSGTVSVQGAAVGTLAPVQIYSEGLVGISGSVLVNVTANANITRIAASNANQVILATNAARKGACFYNEGTSTCFLKFGATASQTSYTVQIGSKAYYELTYIYTGEIDGIFSTNVGSLQVTELS